MKILSEARKTGAHLAEGAAKDTGYVRATVLPARVASSKHFSPLATVRSLGPFSTIGEDRISLMAEVQYLDLCTRRRRKALVVPLPREKRCFWWPVRQCPRQNRTRSGIFVGSYGLWSSNWVTGSGITRSGCQPVLQSNTPNDPHTIYLRMGCWTRKARHMMSLSYLGQFDENLMCKDLTKFHYLIPIVHQMIPVKLRHFGDPSVKGGSYDQSVLSITNPASNAYHSSDVHRGALHMDYIKYQHLEFRSSLLVPLMLVHRTKRSVVENRRCLKFRQS